MTFDQSLIPTKLVEAYKGGRVGLLVGAGASKGAKLPLWNELLVELISEVEANVPQQRQFVAEYRNLVKDPSKFLMLATELKEVLGTYFDDYITERFWKSKPQPTALHKAFTDLKHLRFVVTTNYDNLIELAYRATGDDIPTFTFKDTGSVQRHLSRREFFLLKAHGDACHVGDGIVLTEHDYRQLLYRERAYQNLLATMFTMFSMVFVGTSLADPEIMLLLRYIADAFQKSGPPHYAVMTKEQIGSVDTNRWFKDFNVQFIPVSEQNGYAELQEFVEALAATG